MVAGLAEDRREGVVEDREARGLVESLLRQERDVPSTVLGDRARLNAVRHRALQAALGFEDRFLGSVPTAGSLRTRPSPPCSLRGSASVGIEIPRLSSSSRDPFDARSGETDLASTTLTRQKRGRLPVRIRPPSPVAGPRDHPSRGVVGPSAQAPQMVGKRHDSKLFGEAAVSPATGRNGVEILGRPHEPRRSPHAPVPPGRELVERG